MEQKFPTAAMIIVMIIYPARMILSIENRMRQHLCIIIVWPTGLIAKYILSRKLYHTVKRYDTLDKIIERH